MKIRRITVATAQGVESFHLGKTIDGRMVENIEIDFLHFDGDPFQHYVGTDVSGDMLFTIHPSCPLVVEYLTEGES